MDSEIILNALGAEKQMTFFKTDKIAIVDIYLPFLYSNDQLLCPAPRGKQVLHQRWISGNIYHIYIYQVGIRLSTLALKPRDVTRSPKQEYQWPKIYKKNSDTLQYGPKTDIDQNIRLLCWNSISWRFYI